ncbi:MAG: flagellar hook-basal body complex protein FliE [Veillonellaceae bacterium]|nr:flagellar hook-basal body complex protein FliE [Veillonellaceae bacterium]
MPLESIGATKLAMTPSAGTLKTTESTEKSFGQFLSEALDNVNDLQKKADQASTDLATGKIEDISEVVIAAEKAAVALQLTIQVRNKMLESYQEMMRMSV